MGTLIDCLGKSKLSNAAKKRLEAWAASLQKGELPPEVAARVATEQYIAESKAELDGYLKQLGIDPNQQTAPKPVSAPAKQPKQVTAEKAITEPVATPENDGSPAIPVEVALNKREIELGREVMDLLEMAPPERQKFATVLNQVKVEGSQSGAIGLAKNILANDRPIETKEHAQLLLAMAERYNAYETLLAYQDKLIQEGRQDEAKAQALIAEAVLEEIDLIQTAASRGGTRLGQALAARRNRIDRLTYELVPLIQRARRAKGENLNPEQQEELRKLSQQILEQQAKISALEQELAAEVAKQSKDDAKEFVNEGVAGRSRARRGEARTRRDSLKKQLAALGYRMNDITNVVGLSYEAASIVAKIAETHIEEGAATLSEVTGKLKAEIPDLTENDIYNALGGRIKKAKKQIETEADRRIKELKSQARLWAEMNDWLAGRTEKSKPLGKGSDARRQLQTIVTRLRHQANRSTIDPKQLEHIESKFRELQNSLEYGTEIDEAAMRDDLRELERLMRVEESILDLQNQINTGDYKISNPEKRIIKNAALNEALARQKKLKRQAENHIENLRAKTVGERIVDVLLVPRALQSTLDFSFIGRQGLLLGIRDPVAAAKSAVSSAKAMFSEMTHDQISVAMERHKNYSRSLQAGIQYSELDSQPNKREEHFMTNLAEKIPGLGLIVRGGNRGMITYLNLMRLEAYNRFVEAYPDASLDSQKRWADWVNKASGRGYIGKDVRAWNVVFYAPKYAISRYQVMLAPFKHWSDPTVRKEIGKDVAAFTTFALAMMVMAAAAGLEVEDDPQSSDFGKIRIGNVSYDLLGGMQQPIRLAALTLLSAGKRDERYKSPIDTGLAFLHYKLNPAITVPVELWTGKDFLNRPVSIAETMMSSVTPIILQETYSALTEAPEQTPLVVLGSTVGVGTKVKEEKKSTRRGRAQP